MTFDEIRNQWTGVVNGKRSVLIELQLDAVLESQCDSRGGSLPFKGLASDGNVYWIKQAGNPQSHRVPVTEQLVAGVGRLIDAPVCETPLIRIRDEVISRIPPEWHVSDSELEAAGAFFDYRRWATANRLHALAARLRNGS